MLKTDINLNDVDVLSKTNISSKLVGYILRNFVKDCIVEDNVSCFRPFESDINDYISSFNSTQDMCLNLNSLISKKVNSPDIEMLLKDMLCESTSSDYSKLKSSLDGCILLYTAYLVVKYSYSTDL